jgi:hypothetical protein
MYRLNTLVKKQKNCIGQRFLGNLMKKSPDELPFSKAASIALFILTTLSFRRGLAVCRSEA